MRAEQYYPHHLLSPTTRSVFSLSLWTALYLLYLAHVLPRSLSPHPPR